MPLRNNIAMAIPEFPGDQKLLERVCYKLIRKCTNFQLPTTNSFWAVVKKTAEGGGGGGGQICPLVQTRIKQAIEK